MNVSLQLCGLIIAAFLLILYKSHVTLGLKGERLFVIVILATIVCLTLDILSVLAIHFRSLLPFFCVKLVCKAYLISMVWVGWGNFCYVTLDLTSDSHGHGLLMRRMKIAALVASVVIAALPIDIYENGSELYSLGPAVVSTYIFVLFFIVSTLIVAVYIRRRKNSRRGLAVLMATSLWVLSAALQMLNNALLVVGFSMAVGIMILYVVMENPDSNLDRQLGCFNSHAMQNYLAMCLEAGTPFHVLDFSVTDMNALEDRGMDVVGAAKRIVDHLSSIRGVKVFKNLSTGLLVAAQDAEAMNEASARIADMVSRYREASGCTTTFVIQNAEQFSSQNEILKFLTHLRSQNTLRLSAMVYVSDAMIREFSQMQEIESEIDLALSEDRVEVFLQPICASANGVPSSAEALVRIRKKEGGLLSPGMFIPVAETTGQIKALGERVLEKVCEFLRDTDVLALGLQLVEVNLSAVQCDDSAMAGRLSQIVERYGIAPEHITFEITETAVSEVKDALLENMNALVSKGYRFALDDFGKGESNLMYIVELPSHIIKLDMDLSKAYFSNHKAQPVVESIVAMAQHLNLTTVAEGVETSDEASGIAALGIDCIQGYYYSKPLPMPEFLEYMRQNGRPVSAAQPAEPAAAESERVEQPTLPQMEIRHVLLVEDNEMNREIAQDILEDFGFTVDTAEDGTIAVEKVSRAAPGTYDIVLMDIRMPIMDGYEATRRIRNLEDTAVAGLPIIALTAQDTEEDRRSSFDAGMDGHILKPLDGNKLNQLISELFPTLV